MQRLLFLPMLALAAGCQAGGAPASVDAPADSAAGEVALDIVGPGGAAVVVPVHINGRGPFNLVLDTGATFTCVTTAVADELDLPEQRGVVGFGAGVHTTGRVRLVRYDSVRVAGATARDMGGCVLDLTSLESIGTSVDGLLGLNFLREFDVRLDFRRNVLTLTAPGGPAGDRVTDP
jgi:predicted aspartyl protease